MAARQDGLAPKLFSSRLERHLAAPPVLGGRLVRGHVGDLDGPGVDQLLERRVIEVVMRYLARLIRSEVEGLAVRQRHLESVGRLLRIDLGT